MTQPPPLPSPRADRPPARRSPPLPAARAVPAPPSPPPTPTAVLQLGVQGGQPHPGRRLRGLHPHIGGAPRGAETSRLLLKGVTVLLADETALRAPARRVGEGLPGKGPCGEAGTGAETCFAPRALARQSWVSGRPRPPPWVGPGCGCSPGVESPRAGPDISSRGRRPGRGGDRVSPRGSGGSEGRLVRLQT